MKSDLSNNETKKKILGILGKRGTEMVGHVELGMCPFCSNSVKEDEFIDEVSLREFHISGLCQKCQDDFFGGPKGNKAVI